LGLCGYGGTHFPGKGGARLAAGKIADVRLYLKREKEGKETLAAATEIGGVSSRPGVPWAGKGQGAL